MQHKYCAGLGDGPAEPGKSGKIARRTRVVPDDFPRPTLGASSTLPPTRYTARTTAFGSFPPHLGVIFNLQHRSFTRIYRLHTHMHYVGPYLGNDSPKRHCSRKEKKETVLSQRLFKHESADLDWVSARTPPGSTHGVCLISRGT